MHFLRINNLFPIFLIILCCSALFFQSVDLRKDSFGKFAVNNDGGGDTTNWVNLSHYSLLFTKAWDMRGAGKMNFRLQINPFSIEMGRWQTNYISFSPVYLFPYFLFLRISGEAPNIKSLMGASLVFHFLTVLVLSIAVFFLTRIILGGIGALCLSFTVPTLGFFLPSALFYYQTTYWPDLVGLLPCFLILLAEALRYEEEDKSKKRVFSFIVSFLLFWGILTDWLLFFLTGVIFLFRLWKEKDFRKTYKIFYFFRAPIAAIVLFLSHALYGNTIFKIGGKFLERLSLVKKTHVSFIDFWEGFFGGTIVRQFGNIGLWLILFSFCFVLFLLWFYRKGKIPSLYYIFILYVAACFLHTFIFHQHYYHHTYNALKFVFVIILSCFVVVPAFLIQQLKIEKWRVAATALFFLVLSIAYAKYCFPIFKNQKRWENTADSKKMNDVSYFIAENTKYSDVIFSENLANTGSNSTIREFVAISYKYIYEVHTSDDILQQKDEFQKNFQQLANRKKRFWLLSEGEPEEKWLAILNIENVKDNGRFRLTAIKDEFISQ